MLLVDYGQFYQNYEGAEQVIKVVVIVVEFVELSFVQGGVVIEWRGVFFVVVIVMNQVLEDFYIDDGEDVVKYLYVIKERKLFNGVCFKVQIYFDYYILIFKNF